MILCSDFPWKNVQYNRCMLLYNRLMEKDRKKERKKDEETVKTQ
jgi:hypothetical protein